MDVLRLIGVHFGIALAMAAGFALFPLVKQAALGLAFRRRIPYRDTFATERHRHLSRLASVCDLRDKPTAPLAGRRVVADAFDSLPQT